MSQVSPFCVLSDLERCFVLKHDNGRMNSVIYLALGHVQIICTFNREPLHPDSKLEFKAEGVSSPTAPQKQNLSLQLPSTADPPRIWSPPFPMLSFQNHEPGSREPTAPAMGPRGLKGTPSSRQVRESSGQTH